MARDIRIGIDVGGMHTDAVLYCMGKVSHSVKALTSKDVTAGITTALSQLLANAALAAEDVRLVSIGTTHLLNALLQHQVEPVAIIRIAGRGATNAIPALTGWPQPLASKVKASDHMVQGGFYYTGEAIADLDEEAIKALALDLKAKDIRYAALTGIFAHVNPAQELCVAEILTSVYPELHVSLSHRLGGLGFLERENATICNAALMPQYQKMCTVFSDALVKFGLVNANVYISRSNGTLEPMANSQTPIALLYSGASNSMLGASWLAPQYHQSDMIVCDIGSTSTDIALLNQGKADQAYQSIAIAGVNFNMPCMNVCSIALGGGTIVDDSAAVTLLDESVGCELTQQAKSFAGPTLTLTDIAIAKGRLALADANSEWVSQVNPQLLQQADELMHQKLAAAIVKVWSSRKLRQPLPLLLQGGGALLFDKDQLLALVSQQISEIVVPQHAMVANAVGAVVAKVSGQSTLLIDLATLHEDLLQAEKVALEKAIRQASLDAVAKGANEQGLSVSMLEKQTLEYLPGMPTQLRVEVVGELAVTQQVSPTLSEPLAYDKGLLCKAAVADDQWEVGFLSDQKIGIDDGVLIALEDLLEMRLPLTRLQINDRARGFSYLAAGGGGDSRFAEWIVSECLRQGREIRQITLDDCPDDATVVVFGGIGSPVIFEEMLASFDDICLAIELMECHLARRIDAILPGEDGGLNGIMPLVAAALMDIPVIDAGTTGRAVPQINQSTIFIEQAKIDPGLLLTNLNQSIGFCAEGVAAIEAKARANIPKMGGIAWLAYAAMSGKEARRIAIAGIQSMAENMGRLLRESAEPRLDVINQALLQIGYGEATILFEGEVIDVSVEQSHGFTLGCVVIQMADRCVEVLSRNENLVVLEWQGEQAKILAEVPNIIDLVDQATLQPIAAGRAKYGQRVSVLQIPMHDQLTTARALAFLGPEACGVPRLIARRSQSARVADSLQHRVFAPAAGKEAPSKPKASSEHKPPQLP